MSQLTFNLIIGVVLRAAIVGLAGMLAAHGLMPQGSMTDWVEAVTLALLGVLWSLYQKYVAHRLTVTMSTLAKGASIVEAKAVIANGLGPTFTEVINGGAK